MVIKIDDVNWDNVEDVTTPGDYLKRVSDAIAKAWERSDWYPYPEFLITMKPEEYAFIATVVAYGSFTLLEYLKRWNCGKMAGVEVRFEPRI